MGGPANYGRALILNKRNLSVTSFAYIMTKHRYYILEKPDTSKQAIIKQSDRYRGYERSGISYHDSYHRVAKETFCSTQLRLDQIAEYMLFLYEYTMEDVKDLQLSNYEFGLYIAKTYTAYSSVDSIYEVAEAYFFNKEETIQAYLGNLLGYDVCWDGNISAIYNVVKACDDGEPIDALYEYCSPRLNDNCLFKTVDEASEYVAIVGAHYPGTVDSLRIVVLYCDAQEDICGESPRIVTDS